MSTGKFTSPGSPLLPYMSDLFVPSIYCLTGICLLLSVISGTAVFTSPIAELIYSFIIFMLSVAGLMTDDVKKSASF